MSIEPYDGPRGRSYRVRVDTFDDRGRRKQVMSTFRRKKDAEAFEATWTVKKRAGGATLVEPSKLSVAEVFTSWLESKRHELDDTQIANITRIVNQHVLPTLGSIPVQKLTAHQIQVFLDAKRDSFAIGHGARTVELCYRHLSQALKFATMHRWVEQNEAARLKAPVTRSKRRQPWTMEQLGHFLDVADKRTLGPLFLLAAATGMRRGEVLGLRWNDINWEQGTVRIAQTVAYDPRGHVIIRARTKTAASERTVDLDAECLTALRAQQARQEHQRRRCGDVWQEHGLVFASAHGTPLSPRNVYREYRDVIKLAHVPQISFHDLRHTHATLMIEQGEQIHVVSQRLGHKRVSTTMDIYVKVMPGQQRAAAEAFGERLAHVRAGDVKQL